MSGRGSVALTPMHTAHIFICFLRWSLPLLDGMSWTLFGQISLSWLTQFKFFISQNVRRSVWEDPEPKLFGSEWTSTSEHFCCHPQAILKLWFVKHLNISRLLQIFQPLPGVSNTFIGRYSLFGWSVWFWDLKYSLRILWHPPGVQTWTAIRWESVREWIFQKLSRDSQVGLLLGASRLKFRLGNNRVMQLPSPLTRSTSSTGL